MEKKSANEIIRKIVREEITRALRQELPKIIQESTKSVKVNKDLDDKPPLSLNSYPIIKKEDIKFKKSNNPLVNLLNETAMDMQSEDPIYSFTSDDAMPGIHPALAFQPKEAAVGSAVDMLNTARPSSNIEAVQINVVPDYSALMDKMGI